MNNNTKKNKRNLVKFIVFLLVCILWLPFTGIKAEAAKTCKSVISYPGKTSTKVNIRKKAGTNYKSYGLVKKNEPLIILGYVSNQGITWYKCKTVVKGKTRTGYISGAYVIKNSKPKGKVSSKVKTHLNLRKSTKTSAKVIAKLKAGTGLTVTSIKKVSSTYWYKVKVKVKGKTKTGYVSGKYVTFDTKKKEEPKNDKDKKGHVNEKVTTGLNVRTSPSTTSKVLMTIPKNTEVIIHGTSSDWYKITVTYNNKTVNGYVKQEYITIDDEEKEEKEEEKDKEEENIPVTDEEFAEMLKKFPESYQPALKKLHETYKNWKFVAVETNLDWQDVISNESIVGRNVIQSNYPKGKESLAPLSYLSTAPGAYDWLKDKYTVKDGSNWYSAHSSVIAHYIDPRNFINDTEIFQYEALAYDESQSSDVVQSILNNTFMSGNYNVKDSATKKTVKGSYKQAFMDAGEGALANPYFLASRSKQEVGVNGSNATSGTYKGYEGIYNYYNIGASDGGDAIAKGLLWAKGGTSGATTYGRPWTNPYKSIVGGAKYIAANYINVGQNTLYFQKFNVVPTNTDYIYLHQYMTNVQAPWSEGKITRDAYNSLNILGDSMVFYIPVFKNMPAKACALPAASGNPNPFLKDLTVYNGDTKLTLSSTFVKPTSSGALSNNTYTVLVDSKVKKVTIGATAINSDATINGTGTVDLKDLKNAGDTLKVEIKGIAENGNTQVYVINIMRK